MHPHTPSIRKLTGPTVISSAAIVLILGLAGMASASVSIKWTRQFGTAGFDAARAVTHDSTGVYVAGDTGSSQVWVRKYSSTGAVDWTASFPMNGTVTDAAVGGDRVYVTGIDSGLSCSNSAGFLASVTTAGSLQWVAPYSVCPRHIRFQAVTAFDAGAFVVGRTDGHLPRRVNKGGRDAVVISFARNGAVQWGKQFGTSEDDAATSTAFTGGKVLVAGNTQGALAGQTFVGLRSDAFVRSFSHLGSALWTLQFGAAHGSTRANDISVNAAGIAVGGAVSAKLSPRQSFAGGSSDAYVREYSLGGSIRWTNEFGTTGKDAVGSVSGRDRIWAEGVTDKGFRGNPPGEFVRRFGLRGRRIDTAGFAIPGQGDDGVGAYDFTATINAGFVVGTTDGAWPGQTNSGGIDAFVLKLA